MISKNKVKARMTENSLRGPTLTGNFATRIDNIYTVMMDAKGKNGTKYLGRRGIIGLRGSTLITAKVTATAKHRPTNKLHSIKCGTGRPIFFCTNSQPPAVINPRQSSKCGSGRASQRVNNCEKTTGV